MMSRFNVMGALIIGFGSAVVSGCQADESIPVAPEPLLAMDADQMLIGIEHLIRRDGIRQARLMADTAYFWDDSTSTALRNINLTSFSETGAIRATVTAEEGTQDGDRMIARRNVVLVIPEEDRRIESEELHYDPHQDRIWSDSATVMYFGNQIIRGSSFQSDLDFRNVTVHDARTETAGSDRP
jgi:LPS export ABC transporter protein LptC